jgi:hypothetical protein
MFTGPKADEVASHACEANEQHKENAKELHFLRERIL